MTISFSRYLTVDLYLQKWEENKRRDMTRHAGAALAGLRSRNQLASFKALISCNSLLTDWRSIYRSHLWPDDLVAVLLSHVSVRCSPTRLGHLDSGHCELASFRIIFLFFFVNSYINSPIMLVFCLVAGSYLEWIYSGQERWCCFFYLRITPFLAIGFGVFASGLHRLPDWVHQLRKQ